MDKTWNEVKKSIEKTPFWGQGENCIISEGVKKMSSNSKVGTVSVRFSFWIILSWCIEFQEFPYELFRQMHNDLQSQMMKMTQISRTETPASGMANVAATNNQTVILQRPGPTAVQVNTYTNKKMATTSNGKAVVVQQPEKKTFEQAYREAIERLKAAASGKPDSPGQPRQQQQIVTALGSGKIQQHRQIAASPGNSATIVNSNNRFPAVEPSTSTYSSPSSSSRSAEVSVNLDVIFNPRVLVDSNRTLE